MAQINTFRSLLQDRIKESESQQSHPHGQKSDNQPSHNNLIKTSPDSEDPLHQVATGQHSDNEGLGDLEKNVKMSQTQRVKGQLGQVASKSPEQDDIDAGNLRAPPPVVEGVGTGSPRTSSDSNGRLSNMTGCSDAKGKEEHDKLLEAHHIRRIGENLWRQ